MRGALRRRSGGAAQSMLSALPDELLLLLVAKLDAAAACRLSQVDRTMQRWILLHHEEWVYTWRHARAWLIRSATWLRPVCSTEMGVRSWPQLCRVEPLYTCWWFFEPCLCAVLLHRGRCQWQRLWCGAQCEQRNSALEPSHLRQSHPAVYAQLRPSGV